MPPTAPSAAAERWLRLLAAVRWHRRTIAAALAALAVVSAIHAARPGEAASAQVLVATHGLGAGAVLGAGDLRVARVPPADVPDGALRTPPLGRVVALPIRAGEIVTDVRVLGAGLLGALGAGTVAVPVHVADPTTTSLVHVGDTVDVLAAGETGATTSAALAARVLVTPSTGVGDGVVVLAVSDLAARRLARAAVAGRLSLVLRSPGDP